MCDFKPIMNKKIILPFKEKKAHKEKLRENEIRNFYNMLSAIKQKFYSKLNKTNQIT